MIWPFKKEPAIPFAEYAMTLPKPPCGDNVTHYEADVNGMACPKCRADRTRREKDAELDALTDKIMARLCAPSSSSPPEPSSGALAGMAALVPGACWPPFAQAPSPSQAPSPPTDEMLRAGVRAFQTAYSSDDPLADWRAFYIAAVAAAGVTEKREPLRPWREWMDAAAGMAALVPGACPPRGDRSVYEVAQPIDSKQDPAVTDPPCLAPKKS